MDVSEKLSILADAAKYDVACTSSGCDRSARKGQLGATTSAGICHSFTADGRCITLLKVLFSNSCIYDCAYCVNRASNDTPRVSFKPRELADLTIGFYRRNYIEGLFLSSGVIGSPDTTMELIIETLRILREEEGFRGYIHAKAIPGASVDLLDRLGRLSDRISVNMELPSRKSLEYLAPDKAASDVLSPMKRIRSSIACDRDTRALMRKSIHYTTQVAVPKKQRPFSPAGQSTQIIIGATPETDHHILNLSSSLYSSLGLKRVFFSAYLPLMKDPRLPSSSNIQLNREHRLYQADWLMRYYHFDVDEVLDADHPFLDPEIDPKANWALNHLDTFPLEVNRASYAQLLRVPGIGVKGAKSIIAARKTHTLRESELRKLGIAFKHARFFITCAGVYQGIGITPDSALIRAQLRSSIDGGKHGRRSGSVIEGQLSLFDSDSSLSLSPDEASSKAHPTLSRTPNHSSGPAGTKFPTATPEAVPIPKKGSSPESLFGASA